MTKNNEYNNGWQDGYWFGSGSAYDRGYEEGAQAERSRIKRAIDGDLPAKEPSTSASMVGGSVGLVLISWCFVGVIIFLFWIGGSSSSWWFPWIWRIAFWVGIGFVVVMSIAGIVMALIEQREAKNPLAQPADDPNAPIYKKYPPADVIQEQKKR